MNKETSGRTLTNSNMKKIYSSACLRVKWPAITLLLLMIVSKSVFAQDSVSITINVTNTPIEQVFRSIEQQTAYTVLYNTTLLNPSEKVSVNVRRASLERTMAEVLKGKELTWSIKGTGILILPKKEQSAPVSDSTKIIRGIVRQENSNEPLAGVTILNQNTGKGTITGTDGTFKIASNLGDILLLTSVGQSSSKIRVTNSDDLMIINMSKEITLQKEIEVLSTGFQKIPKDRATGSFEFINNDLINRRVSPDILSRIDGIASGVLFNRNSNRPNDISIRGRSTILSNDQPLIVVDNFPFEGNLNNINPNDIENITILKDAAAASIWGVRAGNGVIIVTTKRGKANQPLSIEINSNITFTEKPNLFYRPTISSSDFISLEQNLFSRGYYDSDIQSTNNPPITPVVELLQKRKNGTISEAELDAQLGLLKNNDVRSDYKKFLYRKGIQQQYSINLRAGSQTTQHYLSVGYDNNLSNLIKNNADRVTMNAISSFSPIKNLEITGGINYAINNNVLNNPGIEQLRTSPSKSLYPYAQLVDRNGLPLPIVKDYRYSYIDTAGGGNLLDWKYVPLSEVNNANNKITQNELRLIGKLKYDFNSNLNVEGHLQYQKLQSTGRNLQSEQTYYTRDLINQFTVQNPDGTFTQNIPKGAILDQSNESTISTSVRLQLNYRKRFKNHDIVALAGFENRETKSSGNYSRLYGYDDNRLTNESVLDYTKFHNLFYNNAVMAQIPFNNGVYNEILDLFMSYYTNASYTYKSRYIISASGRIDQSNYFGVKANQRSVPLWSTGLTWIASDENFYNINMLPNLRFRLTYGYNGNINKSVSALTTILLSSNAFTTGLPYATLRNPPNDQLQWERVKIINLGIDFGFKNNIITGSLEYYSKNGLDLIGDAPIDNTTGVSTFRGNIANTTGQGVDFVLNSINLTKGYFKWTSHLLASYAADKVTKYTNKASTGNYTIFGNGYSADNNIIYPYEGKPVFAIYSYKFAGLDTLGNPQGYLPDGKTSNDPTKVISGTKPENLIYHGPARPVFFGSFRNNFSFQNFTISANIIFKAGYYFRRPSISYTSLINGWSGHGDYSKRWQQKGDEAKTIVPSIPTLVNTNRDNLYLYSDVLIEKGDHIRLQDVQITYDFNKEILRNISLKNVQLYGYINNIGIIWRKNRYGIDPDYVLGIPSPLTYSFGFRASF